jgi:choline dehydrogenase-like flavoprotein
MAMNTDLVIVGSGATGSLLAAKLAEAGKKVVILEGGPARPASDLWSSQIWSRRIHGTPFPPLTSGTDPLGITLNTAWGTGGAAMHHYACWFRLHPEDFAFRTHTGVGLDWPLGYNDLRPYYDRVQADVGISGDSEADIWSPPGEPYPFPALPVLTQGQTLKRGFDALGIATAPTPQAILSRAKGDRAACILDGWCDAGCPIEALANPRATYLKQALAAGAKLVNDAAVSRVLTDAHGKRATGVEYIDAQGSRQMMTAGVIALGAFAIENPRILLNSASEAHPHGLANSSGLVGAYMMTHTGGAIYGLFTEETKPYMGRAGGEIWSQAHYATDRSRGFVGGFQWLGATAMKPNDLLGIAMTRVDLFGQPLDEFIKRASQHIVNLVFIGHDLPVAANRITLSDQKDRNGLPLARAVHNAAANSTKLRGAGLELGQKIMQAAGATEVWTFPNADQHILGGAVMGHSPKESVTNSYGQTHDVRNLFVLGSSLFPTTGAVNPTFTISALTLRTADYMTRHWPALT